MTWRKTESLKSSIGFESAMDSTQVMRPGLEIKLVSLLVLLFMTFLCGTTALFIIRGRGRCHADPETRRKAVSLVSCFAGGVFLATCFLDLVPDYLVEISRAFNNLGITLQFPLPEFIMTMGFFLVLVMEQLVLVFKDKSGGSAGERQALLVESSNQLHNRDILGYNHVHCPLIHGIEESTRIRDPSGEGVHLHVDFNSHSAIRSFILVFSLSLHSMFEGLAIGLQQNVEQVLEICMALLLHKSVVSFSLVLKLTQGQLRQTVIMGCLLLFSFMSPLGIGLGIVLSEYHSTPQHQLARSTLEGLAVGTFIYVTFMEILPHELGSPQNRILKVTLLLTGFALVTAILFIKI
ncbi:zinc transporter ZIP3 [Scleropages formosus]|uniref:Solute carrier family 39 member 1 n=1 Tax=Scleropages formosus TaxID=113540 RepID=A0A8C9TZS3_SCLFO|nr:zinc transporter ZIP1 [Scleropages formosus]XP_018620327.1 zinc transporter ZIP1 [Scleropages formosus]XP_018620328.1 zinc transporter ZIP1 [Scleropages formosus]